MTRLTNRPRPGTFLPATSFVQYFFYSLQFVDRLGKNIEAGMARRLCGGEPLWIYPGKPWPTASSSRRDRQPTARATSTRSVAGPGAWSRLIRSATLSVRGPESRWHRVRCRRQSAGGHGWSRHLGCYLTPRYTHCVDPHAGQDLHELRIRRKGFSNAVRDRRRSASAPFHPLARSGPASLFEELEWMTSIL